MKNIRIFHLKYFHFFVVKFSVYLNRHVFVMQRAKPCRALWWADLPWTLLFELAPKHSPLSYAITQSAKQNFSRRNEKRFNFLFRENKTWHSMWIVCERMKFQVLFALKKKYNKNKNVVCCMMISTLRVNFMKLQIWCPFYCAANTAVMQLFA